jgi:hypothetical protein
LTAVTPVPSGKVLPHDTVNGVTWVTVPRVDGHQVIAFT